MQNPVMRSLDRVPICTRGSAVTCAAWRMEIDTDSGNGSITLIETDTPQPIYRGSGVFLGTGQEQLGETYNALLTPPDERPFELLQLG